MANIGLGPAPASMHQQHPSTPTEKPKAFMLMFHVVDCRFDKQRKVMEQGYKEKWEQMDDMDRKVRMLAKRKQKVVGVGEKRNAEEEEEEERVKEDKGIVKKRRRVFF